MNKKATWRIVGDHPAGKLIGYFLDGVKQCTFVGRFDCQNRFDLRLYSREYYGKFATSGFFTHLRTEESTIEGTLSILEQHFNLT